MEKNHYQNSFAGDVFFLYAGASVRTISGLIFYILIVHFFTTTSVGVVSLSLAVMSLFSIIFSFGLGTAAQHFVAYNIQREDYSQTKGIIYLITATATVLSFVASLTLVVSAGAISLLFFHNSSYIFLIRLISTVLFGNLIFGVLNGFLLGMEKFRISGQVMLINGISYYFGAIVFVLVFRSLEFLIFGLLFGITIGVLVEIIILLKLLSGFGWKSRRSGHEARTIFSYSMPVMLSGLVSFGSSYADKFIVAGILSLSLLGIYNFSLLFGGALTLIVMPFSNVLLPKMSSLFSANKQVELREISRAGSTILSAVLVPIALLLAAVSPSLISLLAGEAYLKGVSPLILLLIIGALTSSQYVEAQAIASVRKTRILIFSSSMGLLANIILSFILIPRFGLMGAAIGQSSVGMTNLIVMTLYGYKYRVVDFNFLGMAKVWTTSAFAAISSFILADLLEMFYRLSLIFTILITLIAGFALYIAILNRISVFSSKEISILYNILSSRNFLIHWFLLFILGKRKR